MLSFNVYRKIIIYNVGKIRQRNLKVLTLAAANNLLKLNVTTDASFSSFFNEETMFCEVSNRCPLVTTSHTS